MRLCCVPRGVPTSSAWLSRPSLMARMFCPAVCALLIFVLCDFVATLYRFLVGFIFLSFSWCLVCYPGFGWGGGCLLFLLLAPCSLSQEEVTATELLASTVAIGPRVEGAVLFFCSCCCLH